MQGRKRRRSLFIPVAYSRAPGDSSGDSRSPFPASQVGPQFISPACQEEHEFLQRFLKLADIALSTPPKPKRKKIA